MPYYPQVNSRFTTRLLAALILLLAAFGLAEASVAAPRTSQATVSTHQRERRARRRVTEQRESVVSPRPVCLAASQRDPRPPGLFFQRWHFQRPPPNSLLSHA